MDIKAFVRGVDEPTQLRQLAEEKLRAALDRFEDRVLAASIRVEDETGPQKSGVDKLCHIEVTLRTGDVRIKEHGDDVLATIDVAVDRLRTALSREIGRAKRGVGEG